MRTRGRSFLNPTHPIPFPIFSPLFLYFCSSPPPAFPLNTNPALNPVEQLRRRSRVHPHHPQPRSRRQPKPGGVFGGGGKWDPRRCPTLPGTPTCAAGKGKAAKAELKASARRASLEAACPPAVPAEKMHY